MRKPCSQWSSGILVGLSLFLAGCGEKMGETTSEAPSQQSPSMAQRGPEEGTASPGYEQGQVGKEEQKPSEKQRQEGNR